MTSRTMKNSVNAANRGQIERELYGPVLWVSRLQHGLENHAAFEKRRVLFQRAGNMGSTLHHDKSKQSASKRPEDVPLNPKG